jgi:hypothetical protein
MLTISKPLSSTQVQTYHAKEFTAAEQNYWKQEDTIQGEWRGKIADKFELSGAIGAVTTSSTVRPASTCFSATMICASVCLLFVMPLPP